MFEENELLFLRSVQKYMNIYDRCISIENVCKDLSKEICNNKQRVVSLFSETNNEIKKIEMELSDSYPKSLLNDKLENEIRSIIKESKEILFVFLENNRVDKDVIIGKRVHVKPKSPKRQHSNYRNIVSNTHLLLKNDNGAYSSTFEDNLKYLISEYKYISHLNNEQDLKEINSLKSKILGETRMNHFVEKDILMGFLSLGED